jgi:hypothetical protein
VVYKKIECGSDIPDKNILLIRVCAERLNSIVMALITDKTRSD